MKKILCFTLVLCSLFLASCMENVPQKAEYKNDRYIYQLVPSANGKNIIVKFDVIEKTAVPACPDPLCEHKNGCPVYGVDEIYVTKNCIYIQKGNIFNGIKIYVYDLSSNTISFLKDVRQISDPIEVENGIVYFTMSQIEYDQNGEAKAEIFHLYKRNELTREFTKVSDEALSGFAILKYYDDEKLVWSFVGEKGYYSTDYNFKNKQPYEFPQKDVSIDFDTIYTGSLRHNMYEINNLTGEKIYIFKDAISFNYIDRRESNIVLYMPSKEVIDGEDIKYLPTRNIVCTNIENKCEIHTWEIPDGIMISHLYSEIANRREIGNYIGIECYSSETDEKGNLYQLHGIFVVNPTTKEAFPIIYEGSKRLVRSAE